MQNVFDRVFDPSAGDMPDIYTLIRQEKVFFWEAYYKCMADEYQQCLGEGLDAEPIRDVFGKIRSMEDSPFKALAADRLYREIRSLPLRKDYPYEEPDELEAIRAARPKRDRQKRPVDRVALKDRLAGAWYGRICGCLLGKTVEGIRTEELIPFLKESKNYPMHRYILSSDLPKDVETRYRFGFKNRCYADRLSCAPVDDDTNYTCLYQQLVEKYGRDFTSDDVCSIWLSRQPITAYCTAERVAYRNMVMGLRPPYTATYENPYREWIGAQIRADYFGYINPGDPETAAEMAWRDARVSHVKNGIYGEMFVSAMIAEAAVTDDLISIIEAGISEIPEKSRLHREVSELMRMYRAGKTEEEAFGWIHGLYDEHTGYGWCHTNSNALIVCASMLYTQGDYSKAICRAVQTGFDTDCNAATVGSILGMRRGRASIGEEWTKPINGVLETSIIGVGRADIEKLVADTLKHIPQ